jgi:monoterpene epsilon-lactone hydrolase
MVDRLRIGTGGVHLTALPLPIFLMMLKLSGRRRRFESAEGLRKAIASERRGQDARPPVELHDDFEISLESIEGSDCYTLRPRSGDASEVHAIYLHGGAHVMEMSHHHWLLLADLVSRTSCTVHVPIYPLAPEHSHRDAFRVVIEVYRRLVDRIDARNVVLMGDSSGGGLALAVAQQLNELGLPQPRDLVLISPWLDVTVSHPEIESLECNDPWLAIPGLVEAGRMWAGGDDTAHPRLSPLNGSLRGLGRITVFIGGRDILICDCRRLRTRAREQGVEIQWVEEPKMIHVWPLLPIRKAALARARLADIVAARAASNVCLSESTTAMLRACNKSKPI